MLSSLLRASQLLSVCTMPPSLCSFQCEGPHDHHACCSGPLQERLQSYLDAVLESPVDPARIEDWNDPLVRFFDLMRLLPDAFPGFSPPPPPPPPPSVISALQTRAAMNIQRISRGAQVRASVWEVRKFCLPMPLPSGAGWCIVRRLLDCRLSCDCARRWMTRCMLLRVSSLPSAGAKRHAAPSLCPHHPRQRLHERRGRKLPFPAAVL